MGDLIQLVVSGTATGAIYALAALGFTLLWQAAGTINFAQGEFVMLPAFADAVLHGVSARRCGSRSCWRACVAMLLLGVRLQARDRRPADQATASSRWSSRRSACRSA